MADLTSDRSARWLARAVVAALAVVVVLAVYPLPGRISDETNFIATAYKMRRDIRLTAATHDSVDVLEHGLEHKHVKMPTYLVVLAAWLELVPDPDHIRVLNLGLYAAAVLLLGSFVAARAASGRRLIVGLGVVALAGLPLGLCQANTAMMESWMLLVGALHFLSWYALEGRPNRLWWFLLSGFLAFVSKESFALLTLAIVLAEPRTFVALHVEAWRRNRAALAAYLVVGAVLAVVALMLFADRGYYPNFRTRLAATNGFVTKLQLVWDNAEINTRALFRFRIFPVDYLHTYTVTMAMIAFWLAGSSRRRSDRGLYLAVAIYFLLDLIFVFTVYSNANMRGQRIYAMNELLTVAAACLALGRAETPRRPALAGALALAGINVFFCVPTNYLFIHERSVFPDEPHVLTRLGLPREGDCLLSAYDFPFLDENLKCELIFRVPEEPEKLQQVIAKAHPRFVILPFDLVWDTRGYREVARLAPRRPDLAVSPPRILWVREE